MAKKVKVTIKSKKKPLPKKTKKVDREIMVNFMVSKTELDRIRKNAETDFETNGNVSAWLRKSSVQFQPDELGI